MMKIVIHFKNGDSEVAEFYTAQEADSFVNSLENVTYYDIVKENNNDESTEQH